MLGSLFAIVILSLIAVLVTAYLYGALRLQTPGPKWTPASRVHISILLGVFVLLKAVAYWLDRYGLAFSGRGIVTGPSYTDVHAVLPAKTILVFVAIICALLFFANSVHPQLDAAGDRVRADGVVGDRDRRRLPAARPALQGEPERAGPRGAVHPAQHRGDPARVRHHAAAGHDAELPRSVHPVRPRSSAMRSNNDVQLRVLDPNVVSQTFEQLQQQRSFYKFEDTLDVDRYSLTGSTEPADRCRDRHSRDVDLPGCSRTSGTGSTSTSSTPTATASSRRRRTTTQADGSPDFIESDIPPTGSLVDFQAQVYFGESSPSYSIVGAPKGTPAARARLPDRHRRRAGRTTPTTAAAACRSGRPVRQLLYAWKFRTRTSCCPAASTPTRGSSTSVTRGSGSRRSRRG